MTIYHKHHIIPRHMGGSDDPSNLIEVTIEQHAALHKQLWEDLGHWEDNIAWKMLSGQITKADLNHLISINAHKGQKHSEAAKQKMKLAWEQRKIDPNYINHMIGRTHSEETKRKMCNSRKSRKPNLGNKHSEESRNKMKSIVKTCPICHKTMNTGNYSRHNHGEMCSQKGDI